MIVSHTATVSHSGRLPLVRSRLMWQLFEPVHDVTYFTPEARAAADAIGMRGFWMGYFAMRAAPLGPVGPDVVTAAFFGFHRSRVARALPDAWAIASPEQALRARLAGADAALRRLWGDEVLRSADLVRAADLAHAAAGAADVAGRVLAAANQALPAPEPPHLRLWQAATTLREHRGDGHVAALVSHGLSPVEAHLLKIAAGEADATVLRDGRHWDDDSWHVSAASLRARGWLDSTGALTAAGKRARDDIEATTDAAAETPWHALGAERTATLAQLLRPLAGAIMDSGALPVPNPIGMPWPPATTDVGAE
jgi:hypothetical protein